jgi:predicted dehydrogenase
MHHEIKRRTFVKTAAAGIAAGLMPARALGANDRVRAAFIGVGNRGAQVMDAAMFHPDLEIVAVCDVYRPFREQQAARVKEKYGKDVFTCEDFRHLLDRRDIDAVFIATPDHWHALQTILACEAGKDVYVEKPLAQTIAEGRRMVQCARRTQRIVQVGLHRRASPLLDELRDLIAQDYLGKITFAHAYRISNMWPKGIGKFPDAPPPKDLNWDLWLGPRADRPFRENIAPYKFRWWEGYSSQMGNWGVHYFDNLRYLMGEESPRAVCCMGGKFAVDDDRTIPDTAMATFEFASGRLMCFGTFEASGRPLLRNELELRGTKGLLLASPDSYEILPEDAGQFQEKGPRCEARRGKGNGDNGALTAAHVRDFLDCIKSRNLPRADVEIGHRSTTFCHLANLSLALGTRLEWDAENERITNHEAANQHLDYEYRPPWKA